MPGGGAEGGDADGEVLPGREGDPAAVAVGRPETKEGKVFRGESFPL